MCPSSPDIHRQQRSNNRREGIFAQKCMQYNTKVYISATISDEMINISSYKCQIINIFTQPLIVLSNLILLILMIIRVRFLGRGGQGAKTSSRILGTASFNEGMNVQDLPVLVVKRRGALF